MYPDTCCSSGTHVGVNATLGSLPSYLLGQLGLHGGPENIRVCFQQLTNRVEHVFALFNQWRSFHALYSRRKCSTLPSTHTHKAYTPSESVVCQYSKSSSSFEQNFQSINCERFPLCFIAVVPQREKLGFQEKCFKS